MPKAMGSFGSKIDCNSGAFNEIMDVFTTNANRATGLHKFVLMGLPSASVFYFDQNILKRLVTNTKALRILAIIDI